MAGTIEDMILQCGNRGMDILYPFLPKESILKAAGDILRLSRGNFLIATGFYAHGAGETDGPLGAWSLTRVLEGLGFTPIVVTDEYTYCFFEKERTNCVCAPLEKNHGNKQSTFMESLFGSLHPVGMISVERCGKNKDGDYTNMRGESIERYTAPVDELFELAAGYGVCTIGIGDGGNEIGMGNLREEISGRINLEPCIVKTDHLLLAAVSNWAAYGLGRTLELLSGRSLMPEAACLCSFFERIVGLGAVDGVTGKNVMTVDGFSEGREEEMYLKIRDFSRCS